MRCLLQFSFLLPIFHLIFQSIPVCVCIFCVYCMLYSAVWSVPFCIVSLVFWTLATFCLREQPRRRHGGTPDIVAPLLVATDDKEKSNYPGSGLNSAGFSSPRCSLGLRRNYEMLSSTRCRAVHWLKALGLIRSYLLHRLGIMETFRNNHLKSRGTQRGCERASWTGGQKARVHPDRALAP